MSNKHKRTWFICQIPLYLQLVQQRVQLIDARLHIHLAGRVVARVQARRWQNVINSAVR